MGVACHRGVLLVAIGARHIEDELLGLVAYRIGFTGDGTVGVEELVGDVGEDGGAARGDAAFGDKDEEPGEKLVDVDAGVKFGEFGEEVGGKVFRVVLWRLGCGGDQSGMAEAKMGAGVQDGETATAAVGGVMAAARVVGGAGFSGCEVHFLFLSVERGGYTPVEMKRVPNRLITKGLRGDRCGRVCVSG